MMSEEKFWKLIEQSNQEKKSVDKNEQGDALQEILQNFSESEIVGFHARMLMLKEKLKTLFMREIAFMMKYGDNDQAFDGFVNWVIVLGKAHYLKAQNSPPYVLTLDDPELFVVGKPYFQDLNYVALSAYFDDTHLELGDWVKALRKVMRKESYKNKKNDSEIKN